MASYSFDKLRGSLQITDTPLFYSPPVGPGISLTTNYNQAQLGQLADSPFAGFGPQWTYSWLSYIVGDPDTGMLPITRFVPGGGLEYYTNFQVADADQFGVFNNTTQTYTFNQSSSPERTSQAVLHWNTSATQYTRTLPDGSYEVYGKRVTYNGTVYYLITQRADAQGNVITFGYDATTDWRP